jgi:hypothetical protein
MPVNLPLLHLALWEIETTPDRWDLTDYRPTDGQPFTCPVCHEADCDRPSHGRDA